MWEKRKSGNYGTELTMKIELGNHKTLNVSIGYRSRYRYEQTAPFGIVMDYFIDEWETKDYGFGPVVMRKCVLDPSNMPKGCLMDGYIHEKRTIGPLNRIAGLYKSPEAVLDAFYALNPGFKPTEVPDPLAIPATA